MFFIRTCDSPDMHNLHAKLLFVVSDHLASQVKVTESFGSVLNLKARKSRCCLIETSQKGPGRWIRYRRTVGGAGAIHLINIPLYNGFKLCYLSYQIVIP